jgi:2',3'-cyclic-nucleotide 2'-phosphodiesterase (5'-nucleotidase family)
MSSKRRDFLKQLGWMGAGAAAFTANPSVASATELLSEDIGKEKDSFVLSILQTTDVHCQLYPHDELFWENDEKAFRKTGGYAHLATYFKKAKRENPDTFLIDTGDMFQGSELSVKTTGRALVPILNSMGYDLFLPGNWEVIYYKQAMQKLLGSLHVS